jgi:uncharacterized protein
LADLRKTILPPDLVRELMAQFKLSQHSVHGAAHWMRVRKNGLVLSERTGANKTVVELFSVFHDSCRHNDYQDSEHGYRGAQLARSFFQRGLLPCDQMELEQLVEACMGHTFDLTHPDITVATCWDADRLDLPRCFIEVDPKRLATEEAKDPVLIAWAADNAHSWLQKLNCTRA